MNPHAEALAPKTSVSAIPPRPLFSLYQRYLYSIATFFFNVKIFLHNVVGFDSHFLELPLLTLEFQKIFAPDVSILKDAL